MLAGICVVIKVSNVLFFFHIFQVGELFKGLADFSYVGMCLDDLIAINDDGIKKPLNSSCIFY